MLNTSHIPQESTRWGVKLGKEREGAFEFCKWEISFSLSVYVFLSFYQSFLVYSSVLPLSISFLFLRSVHFTFTLLSLFYYFTIIYLLSPSAFSMLQEPCLYLLSLFFPSLSSLPLCLFHLSCLPLCISLYYLISLFVSL